MVGWLWKMNCRGCERKRSCPNSVWSPGIYRERLVKITKNSESWTESRTSRTQSRLTNRPTAKFDKQPFENSASVAGNWRFVILVSGTWLWLAVRRFGCDSCSVWCWVLSQGWTNVGHKQDLYFDIHIPTHARILFSTHKFPPDASYVGDFDSSQWKLASLRLLAWSCVSVCLSVLRSLTTLEHLQRGFKSNFT